MNIIFVSSAKYPNGGAATNRHLAYGKGLVELGHDVQFLLSEKQDWEEKMLIYDGILLKKCNLRENLRSSKLNKIMDYYETVKNIQNILNVKKETYALNAVVLLDTDILRLIPILNIARKLNLKTFHERTEYPFIVGSKGFLGKVKLYLYYKYVLKRFNGLYVINKALQDFFVQKTKNRLDVAIVNMVVDPSRFNCTEIVDKKQFFITYCGSLEGEKDGVLVLIEAFGLISQKYPFIKLRIIGASNDPITNGNINSLVHSLKLEQKIELTGRVERDKMPEYLCNSEILALARPNNKQAEGGFPTKLGEYLATGNAVVVTNVGEISSFLTDHDNAFIAEPDSASKFASKLEEAILSEARKIIGENGKRLVFSEFNYLEQAKKIENLFYKVITGNT